MAIIWWVWHLRIWNEYINQQGNLTFFGGDILKKVRYAIEKVIEVPETEGEKSIDNIINKKCKEENGLSYIYVREDDMKENGWNRLFDEM